jgi:hypothetical protein
MIVEIEKEYEQQLSLEIPRMKQISYLQLDLDEI